MAKKYIELDIAKEIVKRLAFSECSPFDKQEAIDGIESIPAADVEEVRHGEWIEKTYTEEHFITRRYLKCSSCGRNYYDVFMAACCAELDGETSKFLVCPNCGAKMDGKEKNDDIRRCDSKNTRP